MPLRRITVADLSPIPKAVQTGSRKRKAQKAEVLTASPYKAQLEAMQQVKEAKKAKQYVKPTLTQKTQLTQKKQTKSPVQEVIKQTVKEVEESKCRPKKRKLNKKQTAKQAKQAGRAKQSRKRVSSCASVGLHLNSTTAGTSEAATQYFCLYCKEEYTEPTMEDWIRCERCFKWCHATCAPSDDVTFVCDYCLYA